MWVMLSLNPHPLKAEGAAPSGQRDQEPGRGSL
jgi:hypothetical protein